MPTFHQSDPDQKALGPAGRATAPRTVKRSILALTGLLLVLCLTPMPGADAAPPVAPRTETLQISREMPFINVFLTAGPFTEAQIKDWTPDGKPAVCGQEPAGLTNPDHHIWSLYNEGSYPPMLGANLTPAKTRRFMLVSYELATTEPGVRYLQMHTHYGRRLWAWQGTKQIYFQDVGTYQTTGATVTLGDTPTGLTLAVELGVGGSMLDMGVLGANGAKSGAGHSLILSLPGDLTAEKLFAQGLIFAAPYPVLNAEGTAELRIWGCSPKLPVARKFTIALAQAEQSLRRLDFDNSAALESRGVSVAVKPSALRAVMDIAIGVEIDDKVLQTRTVKLYSMAGLRTDLAAFDADLAKLPADGAPNTRFQRERIELLLTQNAATENGLSSGEAAAVIDRFQRARALLQVEARGEFPYTGQTGYSEQAYIAPQDGSVQPYLVYVPTDYGPDRQYPLVVYLHGYVPTYTRHSWIDLSQIPEFVAVMERNDCILVVPFGRSNTDFLQVGEADVLAVVARMRNQYSIDRTRTYLYGYSMGGSGVYTMATHYPHLFAAGVVLSGRTDYYLWHRPAKAQTPRFKQVMISRDNPIEQPGNLIHFPVQIHHGQQDLAVSLDHTHSLKAKLDELGFTCDVREYPNGSHWIGVDVMGKDDPLQFLLKYRRTTAMEDSVRLKTWSSQFGARNNFAVLLTEDPTKPAELEAHWTNGQLTITRFDNIAALEVRNIPPIRREEFQLAAPAGVELTAEWSTGAALMNRLILTPKNSAVRMAQLDDPARVLKTPDTAGTVQDAFNGPFILTYGTVADAAVNRSRAEDWAREWEEFAKGRATVIADTAITAELAAGHNLILIGTPASHAYWAQLQPKLPIGIQDGVVTIDDQQLKLTADRGLVYIHPNPLHPRRYVVLNAGIRYGGSLPINHKLDLVPDFLMYTKQAPVGGDDTNKPLIGGFFTKDWQTSPAYIDSFNE